MKKIFLILVLITGTLMAEEFTWADYEILCYKNNKEPSYEEYTYLIENPQCLVDSEQDIKIMIGE